jgi:hypothetical protein
MEEVQMNKSHFLAILAAAAVVGMPDRSWADIIAQWNFTAAVAPPDNSPAPTIGTGTATALGMTNNYSYSNGVTGSVTTCDVLQSPGVANPALNDFTWRIRGQSPGNGWNLAAPQYSQGAQFSASTANFQNISLSFDWYSTTQGVKNMQEQYTTDGSTWTNINALLTAASNDYYSGTTPNLTINFTGVPGVDNNPNFGVRLVSAYDPTIAGGTTYGSAAGGTYNNNSGNWRFGDITFSGTATAVPEPSTMLLGGAAAMCLAALRRRRTKSSPAAIVA